MKNLVIILADDLCLLYNWFQLIIFHTLLIHPAVQACKYLQVADILWVSWEAVLLLKNKCFMRSLMIFCFNFGILFNK